VVVARVGVGRTVQLKPGQKVVMSDNILTGPRQPGIPVLRMTPVVLGKNVVNVPASCS